MPKNKVLCGYVTPKFEDTNFQLELTSSVLGELATALKTNKQGKQEWKTFLVVWKTLNGKWMVAVDDFNVNRAKKFTEQNGGAVAAPVAPQEPPAAPTPPVEPPEDDNFFV